MPAYFILLAALFVSGWMVPRGGFCLVAAICSTLDGRPERLLLNLAASLSVVPFSLATCTRHS